jgi:signal transduction histidine kinase
MMPGLDGFGLLQGLRGDPAIAHVPVMLLSARAGEESRVEGMAAGADDYLVKPFSARELLARVDAHVRLGDLRRTLEASEARQRFLLTLSDALRPIDDPIDVQATACHVLGRHLRANRVGYAEDRGDGETLAVTRVYCDGVPELEGVYRYSDYGPRLLKELQAGRTVVRPDIAADPTLSHAEKQAHANLQLGAVVNVPLVKSGRLHGILFAHFREAHAFSGEEISLLEEVAERTWAALQRARAEQGLRDSRAALARELEDTARLQGISRALIQTGGDESLAKRILDTAMAIMGADCGTIHALDPHTGDLRLLASRNLQEESIEFCRTLSPERGMAWGAALQRGERITVANVRAADFLEGSPNQRFWELNGIAAIQATPLTTRDGRAVGLISTHWRAVHLPEPRELRMLDILVRQAADFFERRRVLEELQESEQRSRQLSNEVEERVWVRTSEIKALFRRLIESQEEERRRIARDIHDQLGQPMTALRLNLEALHMQAAAHPALSGQAARTLRVAQELDQSIDFLTWDLRPAALDHLGLAAALRDLVAGWSSRFNVAARLKVVGGDGTRLSSETESHLYRLVQEALHNVAKHAKASRVSVALRSNPSETLLVIKDDGQGFDPRDAFSGSENRGLGLVSMRERATLSGGHLLIESSPGVGTTITVRIATKAPPVAEEEHRDR